MGMSWVSMRSIDAKIGQTTERQDKRILHTLSSIAEGKNMQRNMVRSNVVWNSREDSHCQLTNNGANDWHPVLLLLRSMQDICITTTCSMQELPRRGNRKNWLVEDYANSLTNWRSKKTFSLHCTGGELVSTWQQWSSLAKFNSLMVLRLPTLEIQLN